MPSPSHTTGRAFYGTARFQTVGHLVNGAPVPPSLHSATSSWEPCAAFRRHSTSPPCATGKPPPAQPYSGCLRTSLFLLVLPMRFAFFGLFDSALRRQGRLLWPLLTPARPSRGVAATLGPFGRDGQVSGNKAHLFPPAGRGFTTLLWSGLGLCLVRQTCPQVGLRIRFLFVSSGFRVRLPSAASSRTQPCLSLSDSS